MKIGLFFGSFDPIHLGHLCLITSILNRNLVDKVIVIPAWQNPDKDSTPFSKRWLMCYQATKTIPNVECWQIESNLHDKLKTDTIPTYKVIETLKESGVYKNNDVYIITTSETFSEIPTWEHSDEILNNNFIIVKHKRDMDWKLMEKVTSRGYNCIGKTDLAFINISSTEIRDMIKNDMVILPYVTENVDLIIRRSNLYK